LTSEIVACGAPDFFLRAQQRRALPLERDLKRAGCPPLERCEVLREIDESGDVHLSPVELQTRLAVPRDPDVEADRSPCKGWLHRTREGGFRSEGTFRRYHGFEKARIEARIIGYISGSATVLLFEGNENEFRSTQQGASHRGVRHFVQQKNN
jgi:hypothetical protein